MPLPSADPATRPGASAESNRSTGKPSILQVSTYDRIGGAERVAFNLHQAYRRRGRASWLAVGHRLGNDDGVVEIAREVTGLGDRLAKVIERQRGIEDFRFPGSRKLLDLTPQPPDVVHGHNLHGGYFDLRVLPRLSAQLPVVLTLHDAWLLSGHCAHSLDCTRWLLGCGHCPDLRLDPPVLRDATAANFRRKAGIYAASRLHVATPSRWLMDKVDRSMLAPGIVESRVIPNGVDRSTFRPGSMDEARAQLGLPQDATILLFSANVARRNAWKDMDTITAAVRLLPAARGGGPLLLIALGDEGPAETVGGARLLFVPFERDVRRVARFYQAADLYVHASRADTFPNSILEAIACGTPVVATAVGGIPEQIDDGNTGLLVPPAAPAAMATALVALISNEDLRRRMGTAAAEDATRFELDHQVDAYLDWYDRLCERRSRTDALVPDPCP